MSLGFESFACRPRFAFALPTLEVLLTVRKVVATEEEGSGSSTLIMTLRALPVLVAAVTLEAVLRALVADFFVPDDFFGLAI